MVVALAATVLIACGAPDELSRDDGVQLDLASDRIAAALSTERRLSRSEEAADRVVARVRKIVSSGALEPEQLDEFGLAALGELRLVAPSLVIVDRLEIPRQLDRTALRALLEQAQSDPRAALKPAASTEVERLGALLEESGADVDTALPVVDRTAGAYLAQLDADLRPVWPDLADQVVAIRDDL
jgi:hypothetical protein